MLSQFKKQKKKKECQSSVKEQRIQTTLVFLETKSSTKTLILHTNGYKSILTMEPL
jgi:hypothetical protein